MEHGSIKTMGMVKHHFTIMQSDIMLVLTCFSICLSEKYDKDLSVGFFIFVMFAVQYVSIAFIGKKYNVDKYDSVEEFIDDNPGVEKWINKTALERMKGKE